MEATNLRDGSVGPSIALAIVARFSSKVRVALDPLVYFLLYPAGPHVQLSLVKLC